MEEEHWLVIAATCVVVGWTPGLFGIPVLASFPAFILLFIAAYALGAATCLFTLAAVFWTAALLCIPFLLAGLFGVSVAFTTLMAAGNVLLAFAVRAYHPGHGSGRIAAWTGVAASVLDVVPVLLVLGGSIPLPFAALRTFQGLSALAHVAVGVAALHVATTLANPAPKAHSVSATAASLV